MMGSKRGLHQTIFAGAILMILPNITLAQDLVQAGVSAAVRGTVQLARADTVGIRVNSGEEIFLNDAITSGTASGMLIMLLDQTIFSSVRKAKFQSTRSSMIRPVPKVHWPPA